MPEPENTTIKYISPTEGNKYDEAGALISGDYKVPEIVDNYMYKTGVFDPKEGEYAGLNAENVKTIIEENANIPQDVKEHFSRLAKQESATISQGDGVLVGGVKDVIDVAADQLQGLNYGVMNPLNSAYKAYTDTDEDLFPPANTTGGQVAQVAGQTALSLLTGGLVAKTVGALLPTTLLTRTPAFITQFLSKQGLTGSRVILDSTKKAGLQVVTKGNALQPIAEAAKVGVGETLTLDKEYRTTRLLADMFGIEEGILAEMAGIEDESFFEEKWNGFLDGAFTYKGGALLLPALKIFGKKLWETGAFATDQIASNELVAPALKYLKKEFEVIQKNFEEIYPQAVESADDMSIRVETDIRKLLNKHRGQKKRAETLARKKAKGVVKGTKGKAETTTVDDGLRGLEEDVINWEELIKNPTDFGKIKGLLNLKVINAESDVIKTLEILSDKIASKVKATDMPTINAATEKLLIDLKGLKVNPINFINTVGTQAKNLPVRLLAAQTLLISQGEQFIKVAKKVNDKRIKNILLSEQLGSVQQTQKIELISQQAKEAGIDKVSKEELMEVLEEYLRLRQIHKVVNGARSDTGLALRVLQEVKDGNVDINSMFASMGVNIEKVSASEGGKSWAQAVEVMAEQVADFTNPSQAVNTVGAGKWNDIFSAVNFVGINNMLSTPATWAVNFAGTGIMTMLETQEKYFAAAYTKAFKTVGLPTQNATTFDEANAYVYGQLQALLEGVYHTESAAFKRSAIGEAKDAFISGKTNKGLLNHELSQQGHTVTNQTLGNTGIGVPDAISQDMINKYLPKSAQLADNGAMSNLINGYSVLQGTPGRLLLGQDTLFRGLTYRGSVHELARKRSKELAGPNATREAINARYRELVLNVPEDIHNAADIAASVTVFQEQLTKKGLGIEQTVALFERMRNIKLDPKMRKEIINGKKDGFLPNAVTSFLLSYLPFIRTPYNITKQMTVQRGPLRVMSEAINVAADGVGSLTQGLMTSGRIGANLFRSKGNKLELVGESPILTNQFLTDPAYRSDALAKMTTGSILFGSGTWFYNSGDGQVIGDHKVKMNLSSKKNATNNLVDQRDIDSEENIIPPAMTVESLVDGDLNVLSIGRGDPLATSIALGAVYGMYDEFTNEIDSLETAKTITSEQADLRREELSALMFYQIGSIFTDKIGLQGVKTLLMHSGATGHPYADPGKILSQFIAKWPGTPWNGFTSGLNRALVNKKVVPLGKQKRKLVHDDDDKPEKDYISGFQNSKIPLYETLADGSTRPLSSNKIESLNVLERALNSWIDSTRKSYVLDTALDIRDYFVNGGESPIRRGACQMVDLEGHAKGFTEAEASVFKRVYEQFLSPLSFKKIQRTNTSNLIRKLNIDFKHPKRWTEAPVAKTNKTVPLDATQQCHWALGFGMQNRQTFNTPEFNTINHILNGKSIKDLPTTKLRVPVVTKGKPVTYKSVSKYLPIKELSYNFTIGDDGVAQIPGETFLAMKMVVNKLLNANRMISFGGLQGEPRFIELQQKMLELMIEENPKVKEQQQAEIESGRVNSKIQTTADQLLNQ
jgi:hypothetical protein